MRTIHIAYSTDKPHIRIVHEEESNPKNYYDGIISTIIIPDRFYKTITERIIRRALDKGRPDENYVKRYKLMSTGYFKRDEKAQQDYYHITVYFDETDYRQFCITPDKKIIFQFDGIYYDTERIKKAKAEALHFIDRRMEDHILTEEYFS